jgi:ATP-dependent RNA helicase RhlE
LLFKDLNIIEPIQKALKTTGYTEATPIQEMAIPPLLEGKDLLGCAQTGTGKTAAFAIPILQGIVAKQKNTKGKRKIKALILAPTRELAIQINDSFKTYGRNLGVKTLVIYGGVSQNPQTKYLGIGIDILVATPGRLLDLINQRFVNLNNIENFVLDEADHMLDMGMLKDVKRIIKFIPDVRQTMFFSATMPTEISKLADHLLKDPVKIKITPVSSPVDIIEQAVYYVNKKNKTDLLLHLLKNESIASALVFSRTKHGADKIVKVLLKAGVETQAIHGNKSQNARQLALKNFKERKIRVLVATDIAARGIDIDELSHVFNYNLPEVPETYVHRIGRTGRAGLGGIAISFCDQEEKIMLRDIQKLIAKKVPVVDDHPYPLIEMPLASKPATFKKPSTQKRFTPKRKSDKETSSLKSSEGSKNKKRYYSKKKKEA